MAFIDFARCSVNSFHQRYLVVGFGLAVAAVPSRRWAWQLANLFSPPAKHGGGGGRGTFIIRENQTRKTTTNFTSRFCQWERGGIVDSIVE